MKNFKKKLLVFLLLCFTVLVKAQSIQFPKQEYLVAKLHTHYHFLETNANYPGLNYVFEAGYSGKMYAVLGFERFSALKGGVIDGKKINGYTSFNFSTGINITHGHRNQFNYNAGIRLVKAYRGPIKESRFRPFIGWEAAAIYQFKNRLGIGIRATIDNRQDQDIFNWKINNVFSSYLSITYNIIKLSNK